MVPVLALSVLFKLVPKLGVTLTRVGATISTDIVRELLRFSTLLFPLASVNFAELTLNDAVPSKLIVGVNSAV